MFNNKSLPAAAGRLGKESSGLFRFGRRRSAGGKVGQLGRPGPFRRADVDCGIEGIVVLRVQVLLHDAQGVAEALEVYDLPFTEEFERLADIWIVDQAQQVVIGRAGFLLCCNCKRTTYHSKQIGQAASPYTTTILLYYLKGLLDVASGKLFNTSSNMTMQ